MKAIIMSEIINDISKHLKVSESEAAFRTGLDNVKDFLVRVILILVWIVMYMFYMENRNHKPESLLRVKNPQSRVKSKFGSLNKSVGYKGQPKCNKSYFFKRLLKAMSSVPQSKKPTCIHVLIYTILIFKIS